MNDPLLHLNLADGLTPPPVSGAAATPADPSPEVAVAPESVVTESIIPPEPVTTSELPRKTPSSAPTATAVSPPPLMTTSQRRGCIFTLLGSLLGAVLGSILTMAVLWGINGTLSYAQANLRLQSDVFDVRRTQDGLGVRVQNLEGAQTVLAGEVGTAVPQTNALSTRQFQTQATLSAQTELINYLATRTGAVQTAVTSLETEVEGVATTAAHFEIFLAGLRELLSQVTSSPGTPTPTPIPAPSMTPVGSLTAGPATTPVTAVTSTPPNRMTAVPTVTATPVATGTSLPTRTPRPTATPLSLPTAVPQP